MNIYLFHEREDNSSFTGLVVAGSHREAKETFQEYLGLLGVTILPEIEHSRCIGTTTGEYSKQTAVLWAQVQII